MSAMPPGCIPHTTNVERDAWQVTISLLQAVAASDGHASRHGAREASRQSVDKRRPRVRSVKAATWHQKNAVASVVDRIDARSILVNWCDSTSCHYCDQLWNRKSARYAGFCALSGRSILRGDVVYAPSTRGAIQPVNERAMILASSLEHHDN